MAKGKKTGGRDFKPGQSGNKKGRPPMPPEIREIKKLSPAYLKLLIAKLARMKPSELTEWVQNQDVAGSPNNLECMLASIIMKAVTEGDHNKLNFLLDRSVGKVVEERRIELQPVRYLTNVRPDGVLIQEVIREEEGIEEGAANDQ